MLLKCGVVLRGRQLTGPCSGLNMHPNLGYLPKSVSREKPREILRTPDGAISPIRYPSCSEVTMLRTILLIIVVLALIGSLPMWPYSAGGVYWPTGGLGAILLVVVILMLLDRRAV